MSDLRQNRRGEVHLVVGEVYDEIGQLLPVKHTNGTASSSGDNTVLSNVSGKKIRVLHYALQAEGSVVAIFQDYSTTTQRGNKWEFADREGVVATAPAGAFLFETGEGVGLDLNLSAAVNVNWHIVYIEAD